MEEKHQLSNQKLTPYFSKLGIWAFSIGTAIGWGSFVITCSTYLFQAGIVGTILGLLLGMAVILVINRNLCYMIQKKPGPGGIYAYAASIRGRDLGFLVGWFLLLSYLAVLWANITSLPLFASRFLGNFFQFGFHYTIFGYEVYFGEVLLSIAAIAVIGLLCAISRKAPQFLMILSALIFVGVVLVLAVSSLVSHPETGQSYDPAFLPDRPELEQVIRIAIISPWAFIGFENAAQFSGEFKFSVKKIRPVMLFSVVLTTIVYIMMSLLSVSAYPPEYSSWFEYIADMGNLSGIKAFPAFYAADRYFGQAGVTALLVALFCVILTSLIGNLTGLSRLLYAFGKEHRIVRKFSLLNKKNLPGRAILAVVIVSFFIPFLGRTAIGWIVDVTTLGAAIIYSLLSWSVFHDAKERKDRFEMITGLAGTIIMVGVAILLLAPKLISYEAMAPESYLLFAIWGMAGLILFRLVLTKDRESRYGHSMIVWIVLLLLMLFTAMMWMNRESQLVTQESMNNVETYFSADPDAQAFLATQIDRIDDTNMRLSFLTFLILIAAVFVMSSNYRTAKKKEKMWLRELGNAKEIGLTDSLTGVRNKYAYTLEEDEVNQRIDDGECENFAVVVLDINDLKLVNDRQGHLFGDECIKTACKKICRIYAHSPVYRYGGDEFVVLLYGEDYENREDLLLQLNRQTEAEPRRIGSAIAAGMADYEKEQHNCLQRVFDLADRRMYERKKILKERA